MRTPNPRRPRFLDLESLDAISVPAVVTKKALDLFEVRTVRDVERLEPVSSPGLTRTRGSSSVGKPQRLLTFAGRQADIALDLIQGADGKTDIRGLVLLGDGVFGQDAPFQDCIASLWSSPAHTDVVGPMGEFRFNDVAPGECELAVSCDGALLLADLTIA